MNKNLGMILLSASLLISSAHGGTFRLGLLPANLTWVGAVSAGPTWESAGKRQTFYLTPTIEKTYAADKSTNALFNGEVFLGVQMPIASRLEGQLGLAVAAAPRISLSGMILDDGDPMFNNYIYHYKIQHTHLALKGKFIGNTSTWFKPWISASIGVGFNRTSFNSVPTIFEAVPTPNFASYTQTTFTYTLGLGIQRALNAHLLWGIGYEFADWGKSRLGSATGQTINNKFALAHLFTNGVMVNFTYLA